MSQTSSPSIVSSRCRRRRCFATTPTPRCSSTSRCCISTPRPAPSRISYGASGNPPTREFAVPLFLRRPGSPCHPAASLYLPTRPSRQPSPNAIVWDLRSQYQSAIRQWPLAVPSSAALRARNPTAIQRPLIIPTHPIHRCLSCLLRTML